MKKVLCSIFAICILWTLAGCLSVPERRKAYEGAVVPDAQLSSFYMPQGWDFTVILFKVDGKTAQDYYPKSISYTDWKCGFNVAVLPGAHSFELIVQDGPYVENLSFTLEGGANYELQCIKNDIRVLKKAADGDKTVDIKRTKISPYKEPEKTSPHGTLVQNDETLKQGRFVIFRVDGLPGTYVAPLGASTLPVANEEKFELRLAPGKHIIDYKFLFKNYHAIKFLSKEIVIEAGKKYKMQITNSAKIGSNMALAQVEFVSFE